MNTTPDTETLSFTADEIKFISPEYAAALTEKGIVLSAAAPDSQPTEPEAR